MRRLHCGFALAALAVVGCDAAAVHRVRTSVAADGRVSREIYQPTKENLPPEALTPDWNRRWLSVEPALAPDGKQPQVPWTLASARYFSARGEFADLSKIPPHYRVADKNYPDLPASELLTSLVRRDLVFAVEYVWKETITDVATPDRFEKGFDYVWDVRIHPELEKQVAALNAEYDASLLKTFFAGEAKELARSIARDVYAMAETKNWGRPFSSESIRLAAKQGVDLPGVFAAMKDAKEKGDARVIEKISGRLIRRFIRSKDGRELSDADVQKIIERPNRTRTNDETSAKPGTGDRELIEAMLGVGGFYGLFAFLFRGAPVYDFATTLPGRIVETNGIIEGPTAVRWKFDGSRLYPVGYSMTARSFQVVEENQKSAFGRVALKDPAVLVEYAQLVGDDRELLEVLRRACTERSLSPLERMSAKDAAAASRRDKLRKFLRDALAASAK